MTSLINWKGGVGKTTLALHLAAGLVEDGTRVLLVDMDPQCNLSFLAIGVDAYVKRVYEQGVPTLKNVFDAYFDHSPLADVILQKSVRASAGKVFTKVGMVLSHQELALLDLRLAREKRPGRDFKEETRFEVEKLSVIKNLIAEVGQDYDHVLLDCPPNVNLVTQNGFFASDYYLIPAIPDFLSTTGISLIRKFMDSFNKEFGSMWSFAGLPGGYADTKLLGIVFNMVDEYGGGPKMGHAQIMANVRSSQGEVNVFERYVTDGDGLSAAAEVNLPVFAYDDLPRARGNAKKQAEYLEAVGAEFRNRVSGGAGL